MDEKFFVKRVRRGSSCGFLMADLFVEFSKC